MAISMYDSPIYAQPFQNRSFQEMLAPAMMMRERHDRMDEQYAQLNNELQKASFIAESIEDENIRNRYTNYMNDLTTARDELYSSGINNSTSRQVNNLRGRFNSEITPMIGAYEVYRGDIKAFDDARAKDPTHIGVDPRNNKLDSYIKNGLIPQRQEGYSGALMAKQVSNMASALKDRILNDPEYRGVIKDRFGAQYMQRLVEKGLSPDEIKDNPMIQEMIQQAMEGTNIDTWGDDEAKKQMYNHALQGAWSAIGGSAFDTVSNKMWEHDARLELEGMKEARTKASKETQDKSQDLLVNTYKSPETEYSEKDRLEYERVRDNSSEVIKSLNKYKDTNSEDYTKRTLDNIKKAIKEGKTIYQDEFGNNISLMGKSSNIRLQSVSAGSWVSDNTFDYENDVKRIANEIDNNTKYKQIIKDYSHISSNPEEALKFGNEVINNQRKMALHNIETGLDSKDTIKYLNTVAVNRPNNVMLYELDEKDEPIMNNQIKGKDAIKIFEEELKLKDDERANSININGKNGMILSTTKGKKYRVDNINDNTNALNNNIKAIHEYSYDWRKEIPKTIMNKPDNKGKKQWHDFADYNDLANEDRIQKLLKEEGLNISNNTDGTGIRAVNIRIPSIKGTNDLYKIISLNDGKSGYFEYRIISQDDMLNKGEMATKAYEDMVSTAIPTLKRSFGNNIGDTKKDYKKN